MYSKTEVKSAAASNCAPTMVSASSPTVLPFVINMTTIEDQNLTDDAVYIPYDQRPETYIVPAVFAIIFVVGLVGNGTLIFIFLRNKSMRSVPNTFIISLSVGDLLVVVGTVPFISIIYTVESWPFGEFICKLSEFLKDVSVGVTVLTLMVLSIDRYLAIAMPMQKLKEKRSKTITILIAIGIWCASIALAIPGAHYSFILRMQVTEDKVVNVCYPFPQDFLPWYPRTMVLIRFLLLYTVPLVVIASFYVLMARHLFLSSKNCIGINDSHYKQLKVRSKVAKIVLAMVVIFAVCFFPTHVFMLWFYFDPDPMSKYNDFWHFWKIAGYILSFANSCMNPIVLYFISGVFRSHFKRYLTCHCRRKRKIRRTFTVRTAYSTSLRSTSCLTASTKL